MTNTGKTLTTIGRSLQLRQALLFIAIALIAIKSIAVLLNGPVPLERDSLGYWKLSTLVMNGDFFMTDAPIAYRTPLYPWFLAACRLFSGSHSFWVIALVQVATYVGSIWFASTLALQITRLPFSRFATIICLLPAISATQYNAAALSESLFVFLLTLHLCAFIKYAHHPNQSQAVFVGFTLATLLLTKPIPLLLWIAHLVLILLYAMRRRKHKHADTIHFYKFSHLFTAACVLLLFTIPWACRNHLMFGRPSLTEFAGRNLWIVTFQDGSGAGLALPQSLASQELTQRLLHSPTPIDATATWSVSNQLTHSGLSDAQADRLMKQVCIDAIQEEPRQFATKMLRRIINYWRCANTDLLTQGTSSEGLTPQQTWNQDVVWSKRLLDVRASQSVLCNTILAIVMGLALGCLLVNHSTRPAAIWLSLVLAYFSVVTGTLEIPDYRYRLIIEPIIGTTFGSAWAVLLSKKERIATIAD